MATISELINEFCELSKENERFINLLSIDSNDCWLFRTVSKSGYSNFGINKKKAVRAHRYAYELYKGKIPEGLEIDHLCSVKNCCNPEHLEAVTAKENTRRAWQRGDAKIHPKHIRLRAGRIANAAAVAKKLAMTHCKKGGHPYDEANTIWRKKGGRECRACQKEYYQRHKK